jgi:thymidylate kinase
MKISYTGTHGTGKSTSVLELARSMKIKNPNKSLYTLMENASLCPLPINQKGTELTQFWIFSDQLRREIELQCRFDIVICDRTIVDSIAYGKFLGYDDICESKFNLAKHFINTYDMIYFKTIEKNDYFFKDGVRDGDDKNYRKKVEEIMYDLYQRLLKEGCDFKFEVA